MKNNYQTKILPKKVFRCIDYEYKGTVQYLLITLDSGDKGLFIHEIYDLIPNNYQEEILRNLFNYNNSESDIWVNENLINTLGHAANKKVFQFEIAPRTK